MRVRDASIAGRPSRAASILQGHPGGPHDRRTSDSAPHVTTLNNAWPIGFVAVTSMDRRRQEGRAGTL
jgi:hypothetical protein